MEFKEIQNLKEIINCLELMDCRYFLIDGKIIGVFKSDFLDFKYIADLYFRVMEKGYNVRQTNGTLAKDYLIKLEKDGLYFWLLFFYEEKGKFCSFLSNEYEAHELLPLKETEIYGGKFYVANNYVT